MAEEKSTKRVLGIVIAVVVVVVCVTIGWYLVTSNKPVIPEYAVFQGEWEPLHGYSGNVELTFRNTAMITAKNVVAHVEVTDQSGETEGVESITIGDMGPGEVAKKSVFVNYESEDTELNVEVITVWNTWFGGLKTREDSFSFVK